MAAATDINLSDLDAFVGDGKWELFRTLRDADPLHRNVGLDPYPPFWALTRYEDVARAVRSPDLFSSDIRRSSVRTPMEMLDFPRYGRAEFILTMDAPRHSRLRRLVARGFTSKAIAAWESTVSRACEDLLDRVASAGECDFVTTVAAQLPIYMMCELFGVPRSDMQRLFGYTNRISAPTDTEFQTDLPLGVEPGTPEALIATYNAGWLGMLEYFDALLAERRSMPGGRDDLMTVLAHAEIDGDQLTDPELLWFCGLLFGAGSETTRNALAGGLLAVCENPDQRNLLVEDPTLSTNAVEEILRYCSPVNFLPRWATRDIELLDRTIPEGEIVNLYFSSANHDERVFPSPETFDITRSPNEHLGLGHGAHVCLGAGLARLELRVLLEQLLSRFSSVEIADYERTNVDTVNGFNSMRIQVVSA